jgi:hypothetical protein
MEHGRIFDVDKKEQHFGARRCDARTIAAAVAAA